MAACIVSVLVGVFMSHCLGVDCRSYFNVNLILFLGQSLVHSLANEKR